MTCDQFEQRYPDIAESIHESSYQQPSKPKGKAKGHSGRAKLSSKVRFEGDSGDFDEEMRESDELVDDSSSYRA